MHEENTTPATPATPAPMERLQERSAVYMRQVLGLPEQLLPEELERAGSPLAPLARLVRELITRRFRMLDRARTGGEWLAAFGTTYAAGAQEGRTPWGLSADHMTVLAKLDGQVAELDDMLPKAADVLVSAAVAMDVPGVAPRPGGEGPALPDVPPARQETARLGEVMV